MSAIDDFFQEVKAFDYKWFDEIGGNQAQIEVGVLRKKVTELRDTLQIVDRNLSELTTAHDKLVARLNDWSETYNNIIADKTCPDEIHCACVPALREEIGKLRDLIDFYQACGFVVIEHVEDDGKISKFVSHAGAEHYPPRPV